MWSPLASASLVFLILYLALLVALVIIFARRDVPWKSRWLILLLHVVVRLASQACGLSFGIIGYQNINLLVAYYVLGAEGYFTLVICTARFLIAWQRSHWNGYSWMEPVDHTKRSRASRSPRRFKGIFQRRSDTPASNKWTVLTHWLLIAANAIIIAGGSVSSGAYTNKNLTPGQVKSKLDTAKGMRAAGQAIFLSINLALFVCIVATMRQHRNRLDDGVNERDGDTQIAEKASLNSTKSWYAHPLLLFLLITWPFLVVRGIFGVLQAVVPVLNYFNSSDTKVYDSRSLTQHFVIEETCLVTMMEFISASILISTYFVLRPQMHRQRASNAAA